MWFHLFLGIGIGYVVSNITDLKTIVTIVLQKIYIPNSMEKINRHEYKLDYHYHGKKYTILFKIKKGPSKIIRIVDEGHANVTDKIKPYLGPNEDSHLSVAHITPRKLGYKQLNISTIYGDYRTYSEDEEIIL